ncbi:SCO6880 family protein [Nonomuraea sp. KM90]|uniref:SCO6880 family protein n=1 Tax=Nonomuraea sp. KM90 TaxID=3457428 RepID=UPI003FCD7972
MTSTSRSYGGWRRSRSAGLGKLDSRQTLAVFAAVLVPVMAGILISQTVTLYLAPLAVLCIAAAVAQRDGVLLVDITRGWARWRWADWRTHTIYLGHVAAPIQHGGALPGVLAPLKLLDAADPGRGRIGVVWNQRTGQVSATALLSPSGALLADVDTVNRQVAAWGALMARMADDITIRHAAVTIDVLPETGTQLADHVARRLNPAAPPLASAVMADLVAAAPRAASRVSVRLTLTCDPARGAATAVHLPEAIASLLASLNGLGVSATGAEVVKRASATDLIRIVRTAFDPDTEGVAAGWDELRWRDAGPVYARDRRDRYDHENAHSTSWVLAEAPRQRIPHDVLLHLLSPGRFRRRVTLTVRALPRQVGASVVESEVNAAAVREEIRRRARRAPTARERADAERAAAGAHEEARGAAIVQWALYVTATVTKPEHLPEARREVLQAAGHSRLRLRPARWGQAAAFAVGLSCGVYPGDG